MNKYNTIGWDHKYNNSLHFTARSFAHLIIRNTPRLFAHLTIIIILTLLLKGDANGGKTRRCSVEAALDRSKRNGPPVGPYPIRSRGINTVERVSYSPSAAQQLPKWSQCTGLRPLMTLLLGGYVVECCNSLTLSRQE
jgi:hypothetical protein